MPDPVTALAVTMQTNFNAKTQRCKGAVGKHATEEINHGLRITWISYRRKQRERRDKTFCGGKEQEEILPKLRSSEA